MQKLALRFISGKYKGGEFPLEDGKEIIVGRSSNIDMVLVEDMVSRHHAKIVQRGSEVHVEDQGSTNGSFVNGEKIKSAIMKVGDRLLVGTSIMKLIVMYDDDGEDMSTTTRKSPAVRQPSYQSAEKLTSNRSIAGVIEEVPLTDLIQLFSTGRKTGTLSIKTTSAHGKVHLKEGTIYFAAIDEDFSIPPIVAFYRMLGWEHGEFEFMPPEEKDFPSEIEQPTEHLLMDGLRILDEYRRLKEKLPDKKSRLVLATPLKPRLADLKPEELDFLQIVHNHERVETVFNKSPVNDFETANFVLGLVEREYLQVL